MRRAILLALGAGVYLTAAWMVAPGFYDGLAPSTPYSWTSPPPDAAPGNIQPKSGHLDIKVVGGVSDTQSVSTADVQPQVVIGFLPGIFDAAGKASISVDIKPVATFPAATGLHFVTNVYQITASAPLIKPANLLLRYSNITAAPSFVYLAADPNGAWRSIGGTDEPQIWSIQTTTPQLGYFAAGYPASAVNQSSSGASQLLPIAVAVLILGVLVAGIPLAAVRRRRGATGLDDADETDGG